MFMCDFQFRLVLISDTGCRKEASRACACTEADHGWQLCLGWSAEDSEDCDHGPYSTRCVVRTAIHPRSCDIGWPKNRTPAKFDGLVSCSPVFHGSMAINWSFISIFKYRIQIYHISYQVGSTMLYYILHILYHLSIPIIAGGYPGYPITP